MKNRIVLISGVIAALVLILFLAYPYLKNSQSFLAVVAICVTFAVLALIPAVVWFVCTWYNNTVYENSLAIILTMTLSPLAMLLADFLFKKYN